MPHLIFVHGRDQQGKNPVELQAEWESAWDEGLKNAGLQRPSNTEVSLPFYGDRLMELLKQLDAPMLSDVQAKGDGIDDEEAEFRAELVAQLARDYGITDEQIAAQLTPGKPVERGLQNWEWVQAILRALDKTPLGQAAIDLFTRDVYAYLTNGVVRREIDKIVLSTIPQGKCVVVAHSLGSIVAYNVLYKAVHPINATRFVTVGSPLGVKAIQVHIEKPCMIPKSASRWLNAYDERDVVALRSLSSDTFPGNPALLNKADVKNKTANRHGIIGYLDNPDVARWIHEGLLEA
jgi:hypothetical protein